MAFIRSIGRWAMTGLVINNIIGSGILGVPAALTHLLGRASPIAMLIAALLIAILMAVITEVASQFSDHGGPYLYVRTAFGRFFGVQVGWFWTLSMISGAAAGVSIFAGYFARIFHWAGQGWGRVLVITAVIAIPTIANYVGGSQRRELLQFAYRRKALATWPIDSPRTISFRPALPSDPPIGNFASGLGPWISALLLLLFVYGGCEDTLAPMGEVKEPRRTIPFANATGLLVCAVVYALLQFVTVATIGTRVTDRPLVEAAITLTGSGGALLVAATAMIASYGYVAGATLNAPRAVYALSAHGDFPRFLSRLHQRFNTPTTALCVHSILVWLLTLTGTFLWVAALSAGSIAVYYFAICAALIGLRKIQPEADAFRLPCGPAWSVAGMAICVILFPSLSHRQTLLMGVTALLAALNWWWAQRGTLNSSNTQKRTRFVSLRES